MRKNKIIVLNLIKKYRFGTIIIYLPHYNISLAIQAQASASAKKARVGGFISDIINNHLLTDYSENYLIFILSSFQEILHNRHHRDELPLQYNYPMLQSSNKHLVPLDYHMRSGLDRC